VQAVHCQYYHGERDSGHINTSLDRLKKGVRERERRRTKGRIGEREGDHLGAETVVVSPAHISQTLCVNKYIYTSERVYVTILLFFKSLINFFLEMNTNLNINYTQRQMLTQTISRPSYFKDKHNKNISQKEPSSGIKTEVNRFMSILLK